MPAHHPLDTLRLADPDTYIWVKGRVEMLSPPPDRPALRLLAQETIWGLSQESAMAEALARGILRLMPAGSMAAIDRYVRMVHRAARTGVTLGRIVADYSAAAVGAGEQVTDLYEKALDVMRRKGTYTLGPPLEALAELLEAGDTDSACAYLTLLAETFKKPLTYNQSLQLVYLLPKSVRRFAERRRRFQIERLTDVVKVDLKLAEAYLDGLDKGLGLLDESELSRFLAMAMDRYARKPGLGAAYLNLSSKLGQDACLALQRAVPLAQVGSQLARYLYARLGHPVIIMPLSALGVRSDVVPWACSDGQTIYLPDETQRFRRREQNVALYKTLARLEAGYVECRTFDFDLERAADLYPGVLEMSATTAAPGRQDAEGDGERFIGSFAHRPVADDLFTLYEQARVHRFLKRRYPGLMKSVLPLLAADVSSEAASQSPHPLMPVAMRLLLFSPSPLAEDAATARLQRGLIALFETHADDAATVETSAALASRAYRRMDAVLGTDLRRYAPCPFPYGRRLHWGLVRRALERFDRAAVTIKRALDAQGVQLYRSDVRNRLADRQGRLGAEDINHLVLMRAEVTGQPPGRLRLQSADLDALLQNIGARADRGVDADDTAFRYPEWDNTVQDYLSGHTRVREVAVTGRDGGHLYRQILIRHGGLVSLMRRSFELLKPEGLALLRQWPEGDAFDYRALLDYAMDRRAGRMPSDRLFIKRLKQVRDVAVLLLVDLSRSTANTVAGGHATVLDVTREALVLFCEALQVVGDPYAIAGFSGTGRHSVDFYPIKRFDDPLAEEVQARISSLSPQRSTRMGAAVRHATEVLKRVDARVRLLVLISDGFPNDLGYKADYAVADTRKSISEARAAKVHVKAITVNIGSDPGLDDLYGRVHHHVIGDVRDLPDKLLRLYGTLTRL